MRILIVGGAGMLGHRLLIEFSRKHEVWATLHGAAAEFPDLPGVERARLIGGVDVLNFGRVAEAVEAAQPEIVVNCVGLIKQRETGTQALPLIDLNARLPHQLAALCRDSGSRLIHFSTDCVFSGRKGNYLETDPTDADDLYGKSKALGEVTDQPHALTIRTSLIGRELFTRYGLIEWFLAQRGAIDGYQRAIFSGFPTGEVADILERFVFPRPELSGVYHVSAEPISKYDLLMLARAAYGKVVEIRPNAAVSIDRSLDSTRFRAATGFAPALWPEMIERMAAAALPYDDWKTVHASV